MNSRQQRADELLRAIVERADEGYSTVAHDWADLIDPARAYLEENHDETLDAKSKS